MIGHSHNLSRILDIPCGVCGDFSSGKHYSIFACDGCAGFFKRSVRSNRQYICRSIKRNTCIIDKTRRNQCKACRLRKCIEVGMNKDAVQHERGSRKSKTMAKEFCNETSVICLSNSIGPETEKSSLVKEKHSLEYIWNNTLPLIGVQREIDLCENAAQLLFMNMQWVKSITVFTSLPFTDQLLLVGQCWSELFILGATEFLPLKELSGWLQTCTVLQLKERQKLESFFNILTSIKQFNLDQYELTYLRLIALFSPLMRNKDEDERNIQVLTDLVYIEFIRNYLHLKLSKYVDTVKPDQPLRFEKMLQLLHSFNYIVDNTIEDLFFKKTIGNVPMTRIISDMYKTYSYTYS